MIVQNCFSCPFNVDFYRCQVNYREFTNEDETKAFPIWCPLLKGAIKVEINRDIHEDL